MLIPFKSTPLKLKLSVIICAYTQDRWVELVNAVESVQRQSTPPDEIIVAVDHNQQLLECVRAHISGVVVVENSETRGLSGARNSALSVARGEVVAFMDEDAVAASDWLEQLLAHYEAPKVIGVGGAINPLWVTRRPAWFPEEFDWIVGCTYRGMPTSTLPVRNLIGCNMSFRREVFQAVGGFTNGIGRVGTRPVGCEETELCIRASHHWPRTSFLYEPLARVQHRVPANRTTFGYFCSRCYSEGLSKAMVAKLVGAQSGLASERNYTLRTLPRGVFNGVKDMVVRRDPAGLARAAAIVAGLAITTMGYMAGKIASDLTSRRERASKGPVLQDRPGV